MIKDWIDQFKKNRAAGGALVKAAPKLMEGFMALNANQNGNGALDARTRELIARGGHDPMRRLYRRTRKCCASSWRDGG